MGGVGRIGSGIRRELGMHLQGIGALRSLSRGGPAGMLQALHRGGAAAEAVRQIQSSA
jgi:hypothetical protein